MRHVPSALVMADATVYYQDGQIGHCLVTFTWTAADPAAATMQVGGHTTSAGLPAPAESWTFARELLAAAVECDALIGSGAVQVGRDNALTRITLATGPIRADVVVAESDVCDFLDAAAVNCRPGSKRESLTYHAQIEDELHEVLNRGLR